MRKCRKCGCYYIGKCKDTLNTGCNRMDNIQVFFKSSKERFRIVIPKEADNQKKSDEAFILLRNAMSRLDD